MSIVYLHQPLTDTDLLAFARAAGAIPADDGLSPQLREFAHRVMAGCATGGDPFAHERIDLPAADALHPPFQGH